MREELPYSTAVQVDEYKLRDNDVTYIAATIYVERANHKKIIIGQKGKQLRDIGAAARKQIEELIEGKVFLELWVKVEPQWRQNERSLKRFGYSN
jgi:GTP-binding protein Era